MICRIWKRRTYKEEYGRLACSNYCKELACDRHNCRSLILMRDIQAQNRACASLNTHNNLASSTSNSNLSAVPGLQWRALLSDVLKMHLGETDCSTHSTSEMYAGIWPNSSLAQCSPCFWNRKSQTKTQVEILQGIGCNRMWLVLSSLLIPKNRSCPLNWA